MGFADLDHFRIGQFVDPALRRDADLFADLGSELFADSVNVLQRDNNALVGRNIDASNTCHARSP